jgi:hypothetical protein
MTRSRLPGNWVLSKSETDGGNIHRAEAVVGAPAPRTEPGQ